MRLSYDVANSQKKNIIVKYMLQCKGKRAGVYKTI